MFEIFKEAVRSAYITKRVNRELPYDELEKPSPGDLRNLFLLMMADGLSREDQETFMRFFKYAGEYAELDTYIRRYDLDKLRPLRNYILGYTTNPSEDVVKMLAILIDFRPRPYRQWREQYIKATNPVVVAQKSNKIKEYNTVLKTFDRSKPANSSIRSGLKLLISLGILSTAVAAVFIAKE